MMSSLYDQAINAACVAMHGHGGGIMEREKMKRAINAYNSAQPSLSNTEILCFILGWQGGTVHQVVEMLNNFTGNQLTAADIIDATPEEMRVLMRDAQSARHRWALSYA